MQEFIFMMVEKFGYLGVFLLIAIENIFPPIPSEVILLFGGFATTQTKLMVFPMIISSTLGSVAGALVLYYVGRILNKDRLRVIVSGKLGRMLRLKSKDIDKADKWFDDKGNKTVFICRFIPIVRSLISIPAGMNKMNFWKFLIYTVAGTVIWNTVLIVCGNRVGENWISIANMIDQYSNIILILLIVLGIALIGLFYYKRINKYKINYELKQYVETEVLAKYDIENVKKVINKTLNVAENFENVNYNMVYVIAAYQGIGYDINNHTIINEISLLNDKGLGKYFNEEEIKIMANAIVKNKTDLDETPNNVYREILISTCKQDATNK